MEVIETIVENELVTIPHVISGQDPIIFWEQVDRFLHEHSVISTSISTSIIPVQQELPQIQAGFRNKQVQVNFMLVFAAFIVYEDTLEKYNQMKLQAKLQG